LFNISLCYFYTPFGESNQQIELQWGVEEAGEAEGAEGAEGAGEDGGVGIVEGVGGAKGQERTYNYWIQSSRNPTQNFAHLRLSLNDQ